MKATKFLLAAFAAVALFACSKETGADSDNSAEKNVNIKLAFKTTRMVENGHGSAITPKVSSLLIEALDASGNTVLSSTKFTASVDIADLTDQNKGKTISVNSSAAQIRVTANDTSNTNINELQGFDIVPVVGVSPIKKDGSAGSGTATSPYQVSVSITPVLARLEVFGGINVQLSATNTTYYAVDVEQIFINNVKLAAGGNVVYNTTSAKPWNLWYTAYNATNGTYKAMFDNLVDGDLSTKVSPNVNGEFYATDHNIGVKKTGTNAQAAGFNIFPQSTTQASKDDIAAEMPHLVLRVKIYPSAEAYAKGNFDQSREFVTVRLFNDGAAANPQSITNMEAGYIYRIDLNDLSDYFKDGEDPANPDPEGEKMSVTVKVKVVDWVVTSIKPEI